MQQQENNMEQYWVNKAMTASTALGHLRGYMIGELLYNDNLPLSRFKFVYETLQRSYELGGDIMDEFDLDRIKKRAAELGITI